MFGLRCLWLLAVWCLFFRCRAEFDDLEDEFPDMPPPMHQYNKDYQAVYVGDKIVDAINFGGPAHLDVHGIQFRADPLEGKVGVASDHGRRFLIGRVPQPDQILYQTERYNFEDFKYDFKVPDDGQYVLVLKFSEVYFSQPGMKVFDVSVNSNHVVVSNLDIFSKVGHGVAHDENVPFKIDKGKLHISQEVSDYNGKLSVQLIKKDYDNPKINAIYIMKGTINDIPGLPEMQIHDEPDHDEPAPAPEPAAPSKFASGPKLEDPYATQDQSHMVIPILVALACFFPILFCLCKL